MCARQIYLNLLFTLNNNGFKRICKMKRHEFTLAIRSILTAFLIMLLGCAKPIIKMSEPLPSIVKEHKTIILHLNPGMKDTGIYLNNGDVYTILAKGKIFRPNRTADLLKPELSWPIIARLDGHRYYHPIARGKTTATLTAYDAAYLYLGIQLGPLNDLGYPSNPDWYDVGHGVFTVDVIVWREADYSRIAAFLEKAKETDPKNKIVQQAWQTVSNMSELFNLARETSKEIEDTKKEIKDLHEESGKEKVRKKKNDYEQDSSILTKSSGIDDDKDRKIAELETKLATLMAKLQQLDEMKKELDTGKEQISSLTKELEEKEVREKDLLTRLEDTSKSPPVIVVATPKDDTKVEAGTITFSGVAEDDKGIDRLDLFVNDQPLQKDSRSIRVVVKQYPKRLEFYERISLQKGENQLKIRAIDTDGLTAMETLTVLYLEMRRNVWAAVIGIDNYQNVRHLKYAAKDARSFYDHLVKNTQIPEENITLLVNQEATLMRLRSILGTHLKRKAGKEDMVIIYFAGHGATEKDAMSPDGDGLEKYLLPYDANPNDLYASALPMSEVSRVFNRIRSERLIFLGDACYSGASGGRTISLAGIRSNISDAFLDRIARGKGRVILTASGPNEVSVEDDGLKHGVFTYFLLEGLRGMADMDRDGVITVDEIYGYVSKKVPQATGQEQHPVKKGTVEGQLIMEVLD